MKILSVNAGSSSLKLQMFEMPENEVLVAALFERIGNQDAAYTIKTPTEKYQDRLSLPNHEVAVKIFLDKLIEMKVINSMDEIKGVGHRVVHGADKYASSTLLTNEVINDIESFNDLAPLHNPANLVGIRAMLAVLPNTPMVAVFDTAFHQTMNKEAYIYAVPYEWYEKYQVRKYGFHGTSHKYLSKRASELLKSDTLKIVTCHLGNGGSLAAIRSGKVIDTTLGFTPLAGIPMGTRCGDIDTAIVPYIMNKANMTIDEAMNKLNKESGFIGISGVGSDTRDILKAIEEGNERAKLSLDIYVRKVVGYIANYYVLLGGIDAIIFSGGIGENASEIRSMIIDKLNSLNIYLDEMSNQARGSEVIISSQESKTICYVIPTNEELMIALDTLEIINRGN